jgi:hypothetical protein
LQAVESRLARFHDCGRPVGGGAKVTVVETGYRLSCTRIFVVADQDLADGNRPHAAISA